MRILLTSTSFQDSPGKHHLMLAETGFEIDKLRGPLPEAELLNVIANYDGIICSDDEYTEKVIAMGAAAKLKIISKYGVGLDSIDLVAARNHKVKVTNCLNVNQITVAEHVFALLLTFLRNVHYEHNASSQGKWIRTIGHDLYGKELGIVGLGKIGKELAKRARAFGMEVSVFDIEPDASFIHDYGLKSYDDLSKLVERIDILSLHLPLNEYTKGIITSVMLKEQVRTGIIIVNTARAKLIDLEALTEALDSGRVAGYLTDVSEVEPIVANHPLIGKKNVIITSHVGSRTYENIERQGVMAVQNLVDALEPVK